MRRLGIAIWTSMLFVTASLQAQAATCPLDHVEFTRAGTQQRFVVRSVSYDLGEECTLGCACGVGQYQRRWSKDTFKSCGRRIGETYLLGELSGQPVVAVLDEAPASPCCEWTSKLLTSDEREHLPPSTPTSSVEDIQLGKYEIDFGDPDDPNYRPDRGPLGGRLPFVATSCRGA